MISKRWLKKKKKKKIECIYIYISRLFVLSSSACKNNCLSIRLMLTQGVYTFFCLFTSWTVVISERWQSRYL